MKFDTYSPADNKFCFSSFLIRGRPGFIFRGEVGVFCAAGWMKWANNSVCFKRYSNLLVRSVCCENEKTELLTYRFKDNISGGKQFLAASPTKPDTIVRLFVFTNDQSCHVQIQQQLKQSCFQRVYHFLLIACSRFFSLGRG